MLQKQADQRKLRRLAGRVSGKGDTEEEVGLAPPPVIEEEFRLDELRVIEVEARRRIGRGPTGKDERRTEMKTKSAIKIELTQEQRELMEKPTGKSVPAVKLNLELLDERIAPALVPN